MNRIAFVGSRRIGLLLKSFGIDAIEANDAAMVVNQLKNLSKGNVYYIILTEETFSEAVKEFINRKTSTLPVIMMLPTIETSGETVKMIDEVVKKAVGISILKNEDTGE